MNDDLRTIGSAGKPGRGNRSTSPSAAARSLAGSGTSRRSTRRKAATAPDSPRLRAVTEDDATAAAAAAEEAARASRARRAATGADDQEEPGLDDLLEGLLGGARRLLGDDWEDRLARIAAGLRHRMSGDYAVDDFGYDPEVVALLEHVIEPLAETWFRLQVRGVENIPVEGGALLVGNHSGTIPLDGLITGYAVRRHAHRALRPLAADLVFALPFVSQMARKLGATLACAEDAERLLQRGELAGVWPEGFKGVGKPYSERYKLQRFGRGGFVSAAMRAQVPIIPVSLVGAEESYPLIGNVPSLARLLGLPYLPITPFFPWLGPLGMVPLPSKWIIEFGEPIRTDAYPAEAADDPMLLFNVTDQVRETIQQTLYSLLVERGNPFV
ncbi:acyltransferase family protein [Aeromicrobium phragmitis]|uniref:Acyltransferase family protein n=1 Tax=Aeromicrobium phragmitis TaxID=2478914 RepID=A0A3L8PLU6_9ACTN|nr:lysophospholipid acyltransferase family protein [Aeromicrobium phragmitis]RLV56321.1 acyltransferase family protein [Aeromicrobium phragmitis]